MSTSTSKPETDMILNRANVALARSQRLVASWLPPQTAEESSTIPKSEEELRREEEEIFTAVPETCVSLPFTPVIYKENFIRCILRLVQVRSRSPSTSKTPRWKLEPRRIGLK